MDSKCRLRRAPAVSLPLSPRVCMSASKCWERMAVGKDPDNGSAVAQGDAARLLHAQHARLPLYLREGAGCVYGGVGVVSLGSRTDRRKSKAHPCGDTRLSQVPKTIVLRPS